MARWNFAQERGHQLHVAVSCNKGAHGTLDHTIEGARSPTIGLAEHLNTATTIIDEGFYPDTVLLVGTGSPGVLTSEFIGPCNTLITRTESKGTLATITTEYVGKGVGLSAENRRVGAILVTELCVDGNVI